jgi:hypothetical protein
MPFLVSYQTKLKYLPVPRLGLQPALEVGLSFGGRHARAWGILDSGSMVTVFSAEVATRLGIASIEDGHPMTIGTFGGPASIYLFEVELNVAANGLRSRFPAQFGFSPGHPSRNILGRNLIFSHLQIGIRESRQEIYLSLES